MDEKIKKLRSNTQKLVKQENSLLKQDKIQDKIVKKAKRKLKIK